MVILKFLRVPRWFHIGKGENLQNSFWICSKEHSTHGIFYLEYIHDYIYLLEVLVQPDCLYRFLKPAREIVRRGLGRLSVSRKNENTKKMDQIKNNCYRQLLT